MSSRVFTAGWLVAAVLLSSWAVSSAGDQRVVARPVAASGAGVPASGLPALSVEVNTEIARLTARTQAAAASAAPTRNLFSFGVRSSEVGAPRAQPEVRLEARQTELRTPNAELRTPTLSGIAEMRGGALTAVISFREELHYVKKGDVIAGRYRVDAVSVEGVDLFDLSVGTILRLSLQRLT